MLTCIGTFIHDYPTFATDPAANVIKTALFLGTYIGGVTFSGSLVAYGKLQGLVGSAPLILPARHAINGGLLAANVASMAYFFLTPSLAGGLGSLASTALMSTVMGVTLTAAIGGKVIPYQLVKLITYANVYLQERTCPLLSLC